MNSTHVHKHFFTPRPKRRLNETYVRTPTIRKIFPQYPSEKDKINIIRSSTLKDGGLFGLMWRTYRINALYHFSFELKMLKEYQKILGSYVRNALLQDGELLDKKIVINIESFPELVFTEKDYPALKITIMSDDEEIRIPYFTGFLLSIERKEGFMEADRIKAGAVILPLFLVDCHKEIFLSSCISFLQENFSCVVKPLYFSPHDLMWMLAMWSFPGKNSYKSSSICLEYEAPCEELNSIVYVIDPFAISEAWKEIMEPDAEELSENQVYAFISILENHFYKMFSVKLSHFQLRLIKTPVARVEGQHSIIVMDSSRLFFVMRHLTHLAQEIMK